MAVDDPHFAALEINDFRGDLSLLNVTIGTNLVVAGESKEANVLGVLHGTDDYFVNRSPAAHAALIAGTKYTAGGGATAIPKQGSAAPQWILKMLAQLRGERPRPLMPVKAGVTDVRFYRVTVSGGRTAIHLTP